MQGRWRGATLRLLKKLQPHKSSWYVSLPSFCLVVLVYDMARDLLFATNLLCSMWTINFSGQERKWILIFSLSDSSTIGLPAKRLCDASSVLVGVELPVSSRFQPSPLASKLLAAASRKWEHYASVSPCQYIAYPQQVLCSAFSWRQVLLGTMRPQHWISKGESVWPNSEAGGWGQEKSQWLLRQRSCKNFSGCKCLHPDTLWQKSPGWRGGRTDMSTSRLHQQEATAARLRGQLRTSAGCRRYWMAIPDPGRGDSTTLAGHLSIRRKTSNRNQVMKGAFTRPAWGKENPKKNRV